MCLQEKARQDEASRKEEEARKVAEAAARALNLCPITSMRACLKKLSKEYFDNLSHSKIQTY